MSRDPAERPDQSHLLQPAPQAEAGLGVARIAGVNLPREKRLEVALTYIFGIGRSTASKVADDVGISRDTKVNDLTDGEVTKLRDYIDANLQVEGDLRR
jgi:small subunit ribosomal protein S13